MFPSTTSSIPRNFGITNLFCNLNKIILQKISLKYEIKLPIEYETIFKKNHKVMVSTAEIADFPLPRDVLIYQFDK
jgi:hypothetical protein